MPAFFVPAAEDRAQAEHVWAATRAFMKDQGFRTSDRRIYAIADTHDGRRHYTVVGKPDRYGDELVVVLLEADQVYLCCTANRGVLRGGPILIGKKWDTGVEEFDPEELDGNGSAGSRRAEP